METEEAFTELVEKLMTRWHYTHADAKVYAALLLSEKPLTIDAIVGRTGLSRSSVSISLSKLAKDYLVSYTKRGKTKLFKAIPGFLEIFVRQPHEHLENEVKPLRRIAEALAREKGKLHYVAEDLRRLEALLEEVVEISKRHKHGNTR